MVESLISQEDGRPIPFIEIDDDNGAFSVNTEAMSILEEHQKKKIVVVSIAGPYRSGKSFLGNRFLNKMKGFTIGSTVQSCTRGIWMWNKLVPLSEDVDALLLDTEGLNSTDRTLDIDIKIFSLSILLSSIFVFNQIGHITEQSIEDLSVVLQLTNSLKIRDGNEEETGIEFKSFFPAFIWVLRDFSLNFKHLTSKSYLEQCLELQKGIELDCFTLVRPVNNEAQLAHIEEMKYEDLREEFRTGMDNLMSKLKNEPFKLKTVNGKALNGSMLLGMALEYVDALNSHEIPTVISSFERVVQVESRRVTEKLFEEITNMLRQQLDEGLMPFEEEEMEEVFTELVDGFANRRICEKLSDIASVENLVELRAEFEKRVRSYFKTIVETNANESRTFCLNLLHNLQTAKLTDLKIGDINDIQPHLMTQYKNQYASLLVEYSKTARGPYKSEAIAETLQQLEEEKESLVQDKTTLELEIEDLYRQIKLKDDEKANILNLKAIELNNLKQNHEKKISEKSAYIKQVSTEIEQLKDQITKNQEIILNLQKTKLKDVSQLKNQHKIMKESLEQNKKKLQENAELMAVNSLFKKLKVNFDEIKIMIGELQDLQSVKAEYYNLQREIQERELRIQSQEYRLRLKYDCEVEELGLKHRKAVEELDQERELIEREVQSIEDAIAVIQNEHQYLQLRLENVKKENKLIEENITLQKQLESHQDSLIKHLSVKSKEEQGRQEELEVHQYEQSVKRATLVEDIDMVLTFMEEFIKRNTGVKNAKDEAAFRELSEGDRESVNEMLQGFNINYKDASF
eukprot:403342679